MAYNLKKKVRLLNFDLFDPLERLTDLKFKKKINAALHLSQLISCKLNAVLQKWHLQKIALMVSPKQVELRKEASHGSELPVTLSSHSYLLLLHLCMLSTCRYTTKENPLQVSRHGSEVVEKEHPDAGRGEEKVEITTGTGAISETEQLRSET